MNRRVYAYVSIYPFLYAHTRILIRTYAYTFTHIRVYLYEHTRIHTCIRTYAYIYTRIMCVFWLMYIWVVLYAKKSQWLLDVHYLSLLAMYHSLCYFYYLISQSWILLWMLPHVFSLHATGTLQLNVTMICSSCFRLCVFFSFCINKGCHSI